MSVPSTEQLLNRLRLRHTALLVAIDDRGTLRAAAAHLGMTQPAASKMLHELEDAIGEPLFERVGRGLQFTETGTSVLNTFRSLRNSVASLSRELHELPLGSAGKLLVGCITAVSPTPLSEVTLRLKKSYPLLSVEIHVDTSDRLVELLRAGKLDLVIGRTPEPNSPVNQDCLFHPIGEEALAVIAACHHPLVRREGKRHLHFDDLQAYPWILQLPGSPLRGVIEQEFRSHHAALPQGVVETSSFLTAVGLVAQSEMLAVIPKSIASTFSRHSMLRILPYTFKHALSPWGSLVHRDRPVSRIMQAFLDHLNESTEATRA